jgi:hypothetical protein
MGLNKILFALLLCCLEREFLYTSVFNLIEFDFPPLAVKSEKLYTTVKKGRGEDKDERLYPQALSSISGISYLSRDGCHPGQKPPHDKEFVREYPQVAPKAGDSGFQMGVVLF